ncbi:hypothetical protein GCM10010922_25330 [Microbacterium sorbitolivorans]|uniref:DUF624 domain-containing protein n=1 Tax=Microbacterium sorbitolivorans TaxID=1867410 RepID=A0A367Y2S4_9MICO|nr:DUF624 domain-containing protein [Microbacterium sorbitolivorans]RCK60164.1 DUF624 domain-containing protein [Microbacterium sorbitolivorans]GGF48388.1 hypothetical protein GCM10010922_25330 [Microbacterium sorbitolivorans]
MIVEDGWVDRIMTWLRALSALIVVNFLIIAGTLAGAVVLGALPALAAGSVCLTQLRDGDGSGIVRRFAAEYRARFWRANALGAPFVLVGALLVADTLVLPALPQAAATALAVFTWVAGAYTAISLVAALAIDVRYRDRIAPTLRFAVGLSLASPLMALVLAGSLAVIIASLLALPMFIPLLGLSIPLFVGGWFVDHRLAQLDAHHPRAAALAR